ncbi:hypothetical protein LENED_011506 [Lentinula edodes]|uniref:Uncharacterized protein n=1 Tax=Lentinula edodes TaxID=5353 RepID=A0A1Q3EQ76_LENED|nr:hypothetical protein LENED_011506 [Lentinula edodes]
MELLRLNSQNVLAYRVSLSQSKIGQCDSVGLSGGEGSKPAVADLPLLRSPALFIFRISWRSTGPSQWTRRKLLRLIPQRARGNARGLASTLGNGMVLRIIST